MKVLCTIDCIGSKKSKVDRGTVYNVAKEFTSNGVKFYTLIERTQKTAYMASAFLPLINTKSKNNKI